MGALILFMEGFGVQELDGRIKKESIGVRQEVLQLCDGMKRIQLSVNGNDEVIQHLVSAAVLRYSA